jgi:hypothetical protein
MPADAPAVVIHKDQDPPRLSESPNVVNLWIPSNTDKYPYHMYLLWVSRFKIAAEEISTPDMSSECHARAFALLLYLRVKARATELGLIQ